MANRLFDLPETKGSFQCKGKINGTQKGEFYTEKKTKTNKDFRAVRFGCEYNATTSVYLSLSGMPQPNVYFSKKNPITDKNETKKIPWANRNSFSEDGWRLIGVNLGLTKTLDKDGKTVNDKKSMTPFDACKYIKENLTDDVSAFIRGNIEFSSYIDKKGNMSRGVKYIPNQISLCQDVDFGDYNEQNKPAHDFTQTIVFMGIDKEKIDDKATKRFIVQAKIVTWSDIVDTEFIITDEKLANIFKTKLKPYTALSVHGRIEVTHQIEEVTSDDGWGEANTMNSASGKTKTELIITGATPSTQDKETYTEKKISEAMAKIRNAQAAEQNYSGSTSNDVDDAIWGDSNDDADDDENPWD